MEGYSWGGGLKDRPGRCSTTRKAGSQPSPLLVHHLRRRRRSSCGRRLYWMSGAGGGGAGVQLPQCGLEGSDADAGPLPHQQSPTADQYREDWL